MDHTRPPKTHGRGAQSARVPDRFGLAQRELDGDWRDYMESLANLEGAPSAKLRTTVTDEFPKTIVSFNSSPDIPFDRSINAYRGCEHGCTVAHRHIERLSAPERPVQYVSGECRYGRSSRGMGTPVLPRLRYSSSKSQWYRFAYLKSGWIFTLAPPRRPSKGFSSGKT